MANRFERIDNTAPVTDVAENLDANVKYSTFDLGYKKIGQALPFAIIPIDCIDTVPNTKVNLNYDVQITFRNPTVRKMLNGWRCYIHSYYNRNYDLWEGWNNFITRGRSGQEKNLEIPHIKTRFKNKAGNVVTPFTPMGLYDYLGYAPEAVRATTSGGSTTHQLTKDYLGYPAILTGTDGTTADTQNHIDTDLADYTNIKIEALKAMMYQRLWRDKYSPKNLLQTNTKVFPSNEDHFILSYNASEVSVVDYENENKTQLAGTENSYEDTIGILNNGNATDLRLDLLRYRQFMGDRFTTSSPFNEMIRGDTPELKMSIDMSDLSVTGELTKDYLKQNTKLEWISSEAIANGTTVTPKTTSTYSEAGSWGTLGFTNGSKEVTPHLSTYGDKLVVTSTITGDSFTSAISLSDLRSLEVFTIFAERMGRTNGDYNEMIKAQFNHKCKSK